MTYSAIFKTLCIITISVLSACSTVPQRIALIEPTASPSPDSNPACANQTVTADMRERYLKKYLKARAERANKPRPPARPATEANPIRDGAKPKHECFLEVASRGNIDLLFVGDSITDFFGRGDRGQDTWRSFYGSRNAANFGISGDTTQDVLWRMQNGELEGFQAKVIVIMLGTNNIGRNDKADIAAGDKAIIQLFREKQPQAKILVLGIFPRGDASSEGRAIVEDINTLLEGFADDETVFYLDAGSALLNADGSFKTGAMSDGVHPAAKGYELWANAMEPTLKKLLGPNE